jgi:hypothetical protein
MFLPSTLPLLMLQDGRTTSPHPPKPSWHPSSQNSDVEPQNLFRMSDIACQNDGTHWEDCIPEFRTAYPKRADLLARSAILTTLGFGKAVRRAISSSTFRGRVATKTRQLKTFNVCHGRDGSRIPCCSKHHSHMAFRRCRFL